MSAVRTFVSLLGIALLWLLVCAGVAALWTLLALSYNTQMAWFSIIAAVDMLVLVKLLKLRKRWLCVGLAIGGTALTIALANWWIAGAQIGRPFGLLPWEAISRIGLFYVWILNKSANQTQEIFFYFIALAAAGVSFIWPAKR